jgi:hypothetical protein
MFSYNGRPLAVLIVFLSFVNLAKGEGASWLRNAPASALNPKISVIADFLAQTGTPGDPSQTEDGFHLREVEIGIQADVDPYARADFFIGGMDGDGAAPELEEGYITLTALPGGVQARGGKFRANFGRLNMVHPHELPQVDSPFVLDAFLGEGRLGSTGLEMSRVFAPLGLFTEMSYAVLQDLGGAHGHGDEEHTDTTSIVDTNGSTVTVAVAHEEGPTPPKRLRNFAHAAKMRFYKDITDNANLDVGISGALYEPKDRVDGSGVLLEDYDRKRLAALDVTFRWKPLAQGVYRSFLWRTEALYADWSLSPVLSPIDGSVEAPAARVHRRGGYSYLEVQPAKRWRFGVRGDYVEDPNVRDNATPRITRAVAPYVGFTPSEFNRFRVQWTRASRPDGSTENRGYVQWTVVLGPHGAHAF